MKFETARIHFFGDVFAAVRFSGLRPKTCRPQAHTQRKLLVAREKKTPVPRVSLLLKLPNTPRLGYS